MIEGFIFGLAIGLLIGAVRSSFWHRCYYAASHDLHRLRLFRAREQYAARTYSAPQDISIRKD